MKLTPLLVVNLSLDLNSVCSPISSPNGTELPGKMQLPACVSLLCYFVALCCQIFEDIPASAQLAQSVAQSKLKTEPLIEPPVLKRGYPENLTCWWPLRTGVAHACVNVSTGNTFLICYNPSQGLLASESKEAFGVSVTSDNVNIKAVEFGEVILSCKYRLDKKDQAVRLEWKKLGSSRDVSFVYFNHTLVADLQKRAEMVDSSIRFRNVTRADAGTYRCEVSAPHDFQTFREIEINLNVLVAPTVPVCDVPSSAMSGTVVELKCRENEGSPASVYKWFKNGVILLESPPPNARVTNTSYTVNANSGTLQFNTVAKVDTGEYYCEASNGIGKAQKCSAKKMQVDDLNIGGIIAAVVVVALVIALCGFGVFFAQRKGYFSRRKPSEKESSHKSATQKENDFKHTKSFII